MLAVGIIHGSLVCALFAPLVVALMVGALFCVQQPLPSAERATFRLVRFFYVFSLCSSIVALVAWRYSHLSHGAFSLACFHLGSSLEVSLRLFFNWMNLVFLFTATLISTVITFFSHRYLHRDPGYRRFFITISLFTFGINLIIVAGSFDLIFASWEIVGLSSFLLIGYFWHRPKAVAAATRAYYIFRICDLGLLAGIMITHFFWHDVNIFGDFSNTNLNSILSHVPNGWRWALSLCILLPVLGKSAQFPFCFWLPKAMEGPTHSSAIFYGSLSIHVGVFLLLRTMPVWNSAPGFNYVLLGVGAITAISATLCAHVQSNIKGQIGYASVAQVGLMLIELSFGWGTVAFFHMVGNAFLRCFQLLVSSSILTTHLHMQNVVRTFGELSCFSLPRMLPKKFRASLYVFATNDGFFEAMLNKLFVRPIMRVAEFCNDLLQFQFSRRWKSGDSSACAESATLRSFSPLLTVLVVGALADAFLSGYEWVSLFSLATSCLLALAALGERHRAHRALLLAIFGNLFSFLSVTSSKPGLLYLIGLITSSIIALEALRHIDKRRTISDLSSYSGLYSQFPFAGTMLLIGCLGIVSFPFSSTFFGEDLLLSLSIQSGMPYLAIFQFVFIISGITVIRFYSKVMMGRRDNVMKEIPLDLSVFQMCMRVGVFVTGNIAAFVLALH